MSVTVEQLREAAGILESATDLDEWFDLYEKEETVFLKTAEQLLKLADVVEEDARFKTEVRVQEDPHSGEIIVRVLLPDGKWQSTYIGGYTKGYFTQAVSASDGETVWSNL